MAGRTIDEILGKEISALTKFSASTLSSVIMQNEGGKFRMITLPPATQWSPVFAFAADDFNGDDVYDIVTAGNFYGVTPYEGRYDASYENVLLNRGNSFQSLSPAESGLLLEGEIRDMGKIRTLHKKFIYVFAGNGNTLVFLKTSYDLHAKFGKTQSITKRAEKSKDRCFWSGFIRV